MGKVELTPAKLAQLKQKAEAAENCSPSPWKFVKTVEEYHIYCEVRDNNDCQVVCDLTQEEAEFIATADPATVLAMVEEIEFLRRNSMIKTELLGKFMLKTKESEAGQ